MNNVYKWIINLFYGFNQPDKKVECDVDGNPVECFTFTLEEKGFAYNEEKERWERTWTAPTKEGSETALEVYKLEGSQWTSLMYGNNGELFYEYPKPVDGTVTISMREEE